MNSGSGIHTLYDLRDDHLSNRRKGLFSVCSANEWVLKTALDRAAATNAVLLIEATGNQVNQFGGYTGMTPARFRVFLLGLARARGLAEDRLIVGADHLGPHIWKDETADAAMAKAKRLVQQCIEAGFEKVHLDTGFGCADDAGQTVDPEIAAERAAALCQVAESAAATAPDRLLPPLYVIGAEVPLPGGALEEPDQLSVTQPGYVSHTIAITESVFGSAGLEKAWERVVGLVVQPGVEFGDQQVAVYQPEKARELSASHDELPGRMTFEVHSTDFQPPAALQALTRDHFTLLKVGPCLTYAFREAIFALAHIETEWLAGRKAVAVSDIRRCLEAVMRKQPAHWESCYAGNEFDKKLLRAFSFRDRIRYYWPNPQVASALQQLLDNLAGPIPISLISQYFPDLIENIDAGDGRPSAVDLIQRRILRFLSPYADACS